MKIRKFSTKETRVYHNINPEDHNRRIKISLRKMILWVLVKNENASFFSKGPKRRNKYNNALITKGNKR